MRKLFYKLACLWKTLFFSRQVQPFSIIFLFSLLIFSANVFAQLGNPFLLQSLNAQENNNATAVTANHNDHQWETIQTIEVKSSPFINSAGFRGYAPPTKFDLDQVRNGSSTSPTSPGDWVNGNAGASNAHYVEGFSIAYRVVGTNVPSGAKFIDIEYDIRHSSANAIDFITNYDLIDFPAGAHALNFGHAQEVLNPRIGYESLGGSNDEFPIPAPSFVGAPNPALPLATFNAIQASTNKGKMTMAGGDITNIQYLSHGDLSASISSTRFRVFFTNTSSTVILSWGGHIAKETDWGAGNSAGSVSGSPYHTRLIQWDPDGPGGEDSIGLGNTDRSLSAAAVIEPPPCEVSDPGIICPGTSTVHQNNDAADPNVIPQGFTYLWTISGNGTISGSATGAKVTVIAGTNCNQTYRLTLTINKNNLFVTSCFTDISVQDVTAPTIGSPGANASVECGTTPTFTPPTTSDACGGSTIVTVSDVTAAGNCAGNYTRTVTWRAVDACSNQSTTVSQTITVRDIQAPTIGTAGGNYSIECTASPTFTPPTASDNCSGASVNQVGGDVTGGSACERTVTRTWRAVDGCGNSSVTRSQTVTIRDIQAPTIGEAGGNYSIECTASPLFTEPTASDNCSGATVSQVGADVTGGTACARTVTRTWRAVDGCSNSSVTKSQVITIRDTQAPTIGAAGGNHTIECTASPSFTAPTASDACSGSTVSQVGGDVTGGTSCARTVTRTWRAVDGCSNSSVTRSQTITLRDTQAPTITSCPADVTVECGSSTAPTAQGTGVPTATDACNAVTVTSNDTPLQVGCQTLITRTWTATDACGNSATCVQRIIVRDRTAPTICVEGGNVVAKDNCSSSANITLYQSAGVWTAIDESGNIGTNANPQACPVITQARTTSQVLEQTSVVTAEEPQKNAGKQINKAQVFGNALKVHAYPNPFNDRVKFVVTNPEAGNGSLELVNALGQKVKVVYNGFIASGTQTFELNLPAKQISNLVYILRIGDKKTTGKLLQINQ